MSINFYNKLKDPPNYDKEAGIHYGVISQHSIHPDTFDHVFREARDLSYEAAVEEAKSALLSAATRDYGSEAGLKLALSQAISDYVLADRREDRLIDLLVQVSEEGVDTDPGRGTLKEALWSSVDQDFNDSYEDNGERSWLYEEDGYQLSDCLTTDVFVSKSPYFTYAPACSPCVPNAGNLDDAKRAVAIVTGEGDGIILPAGNGAAYQGLKTYCLGHDFFENDEAPYPVFSVATGKRVVMVEKKEDCVTCGGGKKYTHPGTGDILPCWRCGGLGYEVKKVEVEQ